MVVYDKILEWIGKFKYLESIINQINEIREELKEKVNLGINLGIN